jgi:hypothetical protein
MAIEKDSRRYCFKHSIYGNWRTIW